MIVLLPAKRLLQIPLTTLSPLVPIDLVAPVEKEVLAVHLDHLRNGSCDRYLLSDNLFNLKNRLRQ